MKIISKKKSIEKENIKTVNKRIRFLFNLLEKNNNSKINKNIGKNWFLKKFCPSIFVLVLISALFSDDFLKDISIPCFCIISTTIISFETLHYNAKINNDTNILNISNQIYELGYKLYLDGKLDKDNKNKFEKIILNLENENS